MNVHVLHKRSIIVIHVHTNKYMYIFMYPYIYMFIDIYLYIHIHIYISTDIHTCIKKRYIHRKNVYTEFIFINIQTFICGKKQTYTYACTNTYIHICILLDCMYIPEWHWFNIAGLNAYGPPRFY
jgi:hypothetical protein